MTAPFIDSRARGPLLAGTAVPLRFVSSERYSIQSPYDRRPTVSVVDVSSTTGQHGGSSVKGSPADDDQQKPLDCIIRAEKDASDDAEFVRLLNECYAAKSPPLAVASRT